MPLNSTRLSDTLVRRFFTPSIDTKCLPSQAHTRAVSRNRRSRDFVRVANAFGFGFICLVRRDLALVFLSSPVRRSHGARPTRLRTSRVQSGVGNNLKKAVFGDDQKRGPNRYTRLLLDDDRVITEGGGMPSAVISDLVRKGPAYEALAAGANDPVIRSLLRIFDQMI